MTKMTTALYFQKARTKGFECFYHKEMVLDKDIRYEEMLALTWSMHVYGYIKYHMGAGKKAPWLTALSTHAEDLGSSSQDAHCGSQPPINPIPENPTSSSGLSITCM